MLRDSVLVTCRSAERIAMLRESISVIGRAIAWAKNVSPETLGDDLGPDKLLSALTALSKTTGAFPIADMAWSPGSQPL